MEDFQKERKLLATRLRWVQGPAKGPNSQTKVAMESFLKNPFAFRISRKPYYQRLVEGLVQLVS